MEKVDFKYDVLANKVVPALQKVKMELTTAKGIASSLDTLSFSYTAYLNSLPNLIADILHSNNIDIQWINKSMTNYNNFSDNSCLEIGKCEILDIINKDIQINEVQ